MTADPMDLMLSYDPDTTELYSDVGDNPLMLLRGERVLGGAATDADGFYTDFTSSLRRFEARRRKLKTGGGGAAAVAVSVDDDVSDDSLDAADIFGGGESDESGESDDGVLGDALERPGDVSNPLSADSGGAVDQPAEEDDDDGGAVFTGGGGFDMYAGASDAEASDADDSDAGDEAAADAHGTADDTGGSSARLANPAVGIGGGTADDVGVAADDATSSVIGDAIEPIGQNAADTTDGAIARALAGTAPTVNDYGEEDCGCHLADAIED